ncbi:hypothetical protein [Wolbachia endosymbiont of Pentidionis agamae]|uniref:hypothetical protein n=1 Tax=Wolbachia endosymbiont of Pentidionis agamae TaxID=3110435 RepID=UPI002FD32CE4
MLQVGGCPPKDFPRWENIYFKICNNGEEQSLLERVLISWRGPYKQCLKRENQFCKLMLKNTDVSEEKGYDPGKKISSIKQPSCSIYSRVTTCNSSYNADVIDRSSSVKMVENAEESLSEVKNILVK